MPRTFAPLRTSIWGNDDFRALDAEEQWLYFVLLSQQGLSMCGVLPYTPRKWARLSKAMTTDRLEGILGSLAEKRYVVVDEATEELLVRTIVRHDPARGDRSIKALWKTWEHVESSTLRAIILAETPDELWTNSKAPPPSEALSQRDAPFKGAYLAPPPAPSQGVSQEASNGVSPCADAHSRPPSSILHPPLLTSDNGLTGTADGPALERDVLRVLHGVAERRLATSKARGTVIGDDDLWLKRTRANLHRESATTIKRDLLAGMTTEAIIDGFEPAVPLGLGLQRSESADPHYCSGRALALAGIGPQEFAESVTGLTDYQREQAQRGYDSIEGAPWSST